MSSVSASASAPSWDPSQSQYSAYHLGSGGGMPATPPAYVAPDSTTNAHVYYPPVYFDSSYTANLLLPKLDLVKNCALKYLPKTDEHYRAETPKPNSSGLFPSFAPFTYVNNSTNVNIGNSKNTTYISTPAAKKEERADKKEDQSFLLVGIIAAAIFTGGAFLLGFMKKDFDNASEGKEAVKKLKEALEPQNGLAHDPKLTIKATELSTDADKLFNAVHTNAFWRTAAVASIVGGAAIALVGAFIASQALVTAGTAVGVAALAFALFRTAYTWNDNEKFEKLATNILNSCSLSHRDLDQYKTQ